MLVHQRVAGNQVDVGDICWASDPGQHEPKNEAAGHPDHQTSPDSANDIKVKPHQRTPR